MSPLRLLVWILGSPSIWNEPWASKLLVPLGDITWPYHQHAVKQTPAGLMLYDNGNYRAGAYEEPTTSPYSRAFLYEVDEENMTVREIWSYGPSSGPDSFYSYFMGDADWQPATVACCSRTAPSFRTNSPHYIYRAERIRDIRQ